jgi:hypothetical protein
MALTVIEFSSPDGLGISPGKKRIRSALEPTAGND